MTIKERLEPQAYEKLRTLIKQKTSYSNLTKDNIDETKKAVELLLTWLDSIYQIDRKEIEMDEEGLDILNLFKVTQ
jgi:DNA-binding transcriptional regulator GbsR (MarR family)